MVVQIAHMQCFYALFSIWNVQDEGWTTTGPLSIPRRVAHTTYTSTDGLAEVFALLGWLAFASAAPAARGPSPSRCVDVA